MFSYAHKIKIYDRYYMGELIVGRVFVISWQVDYGSGSVKKARTFTRLTDEAGIQRFKKRWRLR
jgi:hypothetical protein